MKRSLFAAAVVCVIFALVAVIFALVAVSGGVADVLGTRSDAPERPGRPLAPLPTGVHRLANDVNHAQEAIDDRASPSRALAGAALVEQLATGVLAHERASARQATLAQLRPGAAATMRTDLAASGALTPLAVREKRFPPWRIVQPPGSGTLLSYFRQAQSRFGVGWQYLAAIELIETRFGRVHGPSSAGAQGPMQFLPSTWETYGRGGIDDQRDAILAAARFLVANGAPADMAAALFQYNNSTAYVAAVEDYARRMRADPRAYVGYYNWQVIYARTGGDFLLPVGYPRARPRRVAGP